ncbi:MAG TPA: rhodanese-like domain-containing protein [Bryobacteraceae bacterium]
MSQTHRLLAIVAAVLGGAAFLSSFSRSADPSELASEIEAESDHMSALDLATRIMHEDKNLRIFDLRSQAEFEQFHIPTAQPMAIEAITKSVLPRDADIVLYSEGGTHAAQAWVLMRMRGYRRVFVLREGIYEWQSRVMEPRLAIDATAAEKAEFEKASELSRFFGGNPEMGVPRSQVPSGYWTTQQSETPQTHTAPFRRRGC